jgi:hypothetical protein
MVRGGFVEQEKKRLFDLVIDARRFPGLLHLVLPPPLFPKDPAKQAEGFEVRSNSLVKRWATAHLKDVEGLFYEAKYPQEQYRLMAAAIKKVAGQKPLVLKGGKLSAIRSLSISREAEHAIFFRIDPPEGAKVGSVFEFDVIQQDSRNKTPLSGSRYRVVVNKQVRQGRDIKAG